MGDTNCDLSSNLTGSFSDKNSISIRNIYELFATEPNRVTPTTSILIDHISTTKASVSDDYIVFCIRKRNATASGGHRLVETRNMKYINEEAFVADAFRLCWEQIVYKTDEINTLVC